MGPHAPCPVTAVHAGGAGGAEPYPAGLTPWCRNASDQGCCARSYVGQHASCPVTVVHAGGACEDRRNSIGAGLRKGLEKLSLLPGGKGAGLFGRDKGAAALQPGPTGACWAAVTP